MDMNFPQSRAKGRVGETIVENIFEMLDAYEVIEFGVEKRSVELKTHIRNRYQTETNKKIKCMPDYIVLDKDKKETYFIEVKYNFGLKFFREHATELIFGRGEIQNYIKYWKDTILVIVFNVKPYCICLRLSDIDPSKHCVGCKEVNGKFKDFWNFFGIYKNLDELFPAVTQKHIEDVINLNRDKG